MEILEGLAALKSVKSIYDIAKEVRNSQDVDKLRIAAAQMFDLALAAREQTAALQEERNDAVTAISKLKEELSRLRAWETEEMRYRLTSISEGAFAYALASVDANGEPAHWLCPTCFQQRRKSVMQRGNHEGMYSDQFNWECPACKTSMKVKDTIKPALV